ncbi:MFS transporter [Halalkalibacter okhensis]|uniref:MFS transporter n=1 Tax=Halalkalibacter okhensis TaxID=333138 RepID=A0A0B0IE58_9BACI|nr:MFS transporter [Halalkalibacter okhensis]KHF37941.1 MFS transporter [Halalkalibacter okhensis]
MRISSKKRVIGIALLTAVAVMGDAMLFIVLPLYWEDFGLTALWQIGVLLSVNRFVRLPLNPLVGLFYKHFQVRTGVFIAVGLACLTTMSYGILQDFWLLLLVRALWGVAWSLLRLGGYLTVIEAADDSNRGRFVGLYNGLWGIGGLIGMLAGGILVDYTSVSFVTVLFALFALVAFPLVWLLVPVKAPEKKEQQQSQQYTSWFTSRVALVLLTSLGMGFIVFGLFASTLSPLIERSYKADWTGAQITIGAATLAGVIQAVRWGWDPFVAPWIGKCLDRSTSKIRLLLIPLFSGSILLFLLGYIQSLFLLFLLLLVFQFTSTFFVTTTDTFATEVASQSNRVKVITAHTIAVDLGAALGPLVAFYLLEFYSISIVYFLAASFLMLLGFMWLYQLCRNAQKDVTLHRETRVK